jgi:hypothetical protein
MIKVGSNTAKLLSNLFNSALKNVGRVHNNLDPTWSKSGFAAVNNNVVKGRITI